MYFKCFYKNDLKVFNKYLKCIHKVFKKHLKSIQKVFQMHLQSIQGEAWPLKYISPRQEIGSITGFRQNSIPISQGR